MIFFFFTDVWRSTLFHSISPFPCLRYHLNFTERIACCTSMFFNNIPTDWKINPCTLSHFTLEVLRKHLQSLIYANVIRQFTNFPKMQRKQFWLFSFFIHTRTRRAQAALAIGLCLCSERKLAADFDDSILVFWTFSNKLRYFFIFLRVLLSPCLFVVPTVSLMICLCD